MRKYMILLWVFLGLGVTAQEGGILHALRIVPQAYYSEPARVSPYKFYIGFPGLAGISTELESGNLSYHAVFSRDANDSLLIDTDKLLSHLEKENRVTFELANQLLAFGVRFGKHALNFNFSNRIDTRLTFTDDEMTFLLKGNAPFIGQSVNLAGIRIKMNAYSEIGLGYSRILDDHWSTGIRVKYLQGYVNAESVRSKVSFYTDPDNFDITATSDILIRGASPINDLNKPGKINMKDMMKNNGIAFDAGVNYIRNDHWSFSLNVLDFGYIYWKSNVKEIRSKTPNSSFTFSGIELNEAFINGKFNDSILQSKIDTLDKVFGLETVDGKPYRSWLRTKINLSANYHLTAKNEFSAYWRNVMDGKDYSTFLTLSYMRTLGRNFNLAIANTFSNNNYFNPGIGTAVNLGPVQFYLSVEHVNSVWASEINSFGFRFGINLVFGKDKKVKKTPPPPVDSPPPVPAPPQDPKP